MESFLLIAIGTLIGYFGMNLLIHLVGFPVTLAIFVVGIVLYFSGNAEAADLVAEPTGMNNLEWYLITAVIVLSTLMAVQLYKASGTMTGPKARWKIKQASDNTWVIYHKGLISRIWWKIRVVSFKETAEGYIKRSAAPQQTLYDSKGNTLL